MGARGRRNAQQKPSIHPLIPVIPAYISMVIAGVTAYRAWAANVEGDRELLAIQQIVAEVRADSTLAKSLGDLREGVGVVQDGMRVLLVRTGPLEEDGVRTALFTGEGLCRPRGR